MSERRARFAKKKEEKAMKMAEGAAINASGSAAGIYTKPSASETGANPGANYIEARPDDDNIKPVGQNWWVLSYVAPEGTALKSKHVMLKNSGVFSNEKDAEEQAAKVRLQTHHKLIDSFVVPIGVHLTVPMPDYCKLTCKKNYSNNEVVDKIMQGAWAATEESRKNLTRKERTAKEENLRRMRAIHGPDYELPKRSEEEEQKRQQEEAEKLTQKPPAEEEKLSSYDTCLLMTKYLIESGFMKDGQLVDPSAPAPQPTDPVAESAEQTPPTAPLPKVPELVKKMVIGFKNFLDTEKVKMTQAPPAGALSNSKASSSPMPTVTQ